MRETVDRVRLLHLYRAVRGRTLALCEPLCVEDQVVQSMPDASPTKWHLAHTSWFFETFVLRSHRPDYAPIDERYAFLFNSYYHSAGERHPRPERGLLSRPTIEEVRAYREHVDRSMERLLGGDGATLDAELAFVVELGLNHEEQHQELILTDVKHVLALNPLEPAYRPPSPRPPSAPASRQEWSSFDGGLVSLGNDSAAFCFDNERPRHRRWLEPYELARAPVRCGEYLKFIGDGGYSRPDLWLSDGWEACARLGWRAPLYWRGDGLAWRIATLTGTREIDADEPVCHVSYYEADAFARWRGARLPLEEEWEHAADGVTVEGNLLESERFHPAPARTAANGPSQMFGDVWEWTASSYSPYPGFQPFRGGLGEYNGKFMCGRFVLRGGSCVTPERHIRGTYRNFFTPEARWQFTGIRLARTLR